MWAGGYCWYFWFGQGVDHWNSFDGLVLDLAWRASSRKGVEVWEARAWWRGWSEVSSEVYFMFT